MMPAPNPFYMMYLDILIKELQEQKKRASETELNFRCDKCGDIVPHYKAMLENHAISKHNGIGVFYPTGAQ